MSFRAKVLAGITGTAALAVWLVAWMISAQITRTYEGSEARRAANLTAQFQREFNRRSTEIAQRVGAIAASDSLTRMAAALAEPGADPLQLTTEAEPLARDQGLDVLAILNRDGTIVSSAHWPARFGYREEWMQPGVNWNAAPVFLKREDLADGPVLALMAVRTVKSGDGFIYVAGGEKLEQQFLSTLGLPEGMRVTVYREGDNVQTPAAGLGRLVEEVRSGAKETTRVVDTPGGEEVATAIPLPGRDGKILAVLLAVQSRRELLALRADVRRTALTVGALAVLAGLIAGFWVASRVTRPVRRLAGTVQELTAGNWGARAEAASRDEIGQLARDFNTMAQELQDQRDRMLQAERVAAWREIARRLAHELKNPLFPLQVTVENLRRARVAIPEEFDEVFEESTATLLAEIGNLKTIISRFGDFARMPAPQFESVSLNDIAEESLRLFDAHAKGEGRPKVETRMELAADIPNIQADPEQMRRAIRNLALNAMDAMPEGGTLTIRTAAREGRVVLEVADTGQGLMPEERARLFTPYYTTKLHGTGLGLAIVQSVVSDHGGTITVDSEPGAGSTFRIELKA